MQLTIEQAIQQAIEHHRAGRLPDAERLYRAILNAQPSHPDANHNLGVLAMQVKNVPAALPFLKAALESNPAQGQYWLSYIEALIHAGSMDDARTVLERGRTHGLSGAAVDDIAARLRSQGNMEEPVPAPVETATDSDGSLKAKEEHPVARDRRKTSGAATALRQAPGPAEINQLVSLFSAARYAEVADAARKISERYPRHPLAWKVLGSALQRMGMNAEAVQPTLKCAELSPADAEAHCNLAIILKELGRLDEAEASCRRALKVKPRYGDALGCLGTILKESGRPDEAESAFRRAIDIVPGHLDAHIHLGGLLYDAGKLSEAETYCRKAIALTPGVAVAHNNLGLTLKDLGRLDEAAAAFRQALQLRPDYVAAQFNLAETFCYLDDLRQAAHAYELVYQLPGTGVALDALAYRAILHFLHGDMDRAEQALQGTQAVTGTKGTMHKNAYIYSQYLTRLISWHRQHREQEHARDGDATLYVIGESHALSPHGMVVRINDERAVCKAEWISGCKQWHLGNAKDNAYKRKFGAIAARLPKEASVLTMIGEIDCRLDEGIIVASTKASAKGLPAIVEETAAAYVDFLARTAALRDMKIIVAGVPAPNAALTAASQAGLEQLVFVIRSLNRTVKERALHAGMGYLDLFALTDRGDGASAGDWHIDTHHLLPSAVPEAFDRFFYPPSAGSR